MENKNILIFNFFLFILIIYCFYKINILNENFVTTPSTEDQIKTAVKRIYLADVEAIRILSNFAIQLSQGGMTIPGNIMVNGGIKIINDINTDSDIKLGGGAGNGGRQWIIHCPSWSGGDHFIIGPTHKVASSGWNFGNQFDFRDDGTLIVKKLIVKEDLAIKGTIYGNITEVIDATKPVVENRPAYTGQWTNIAPVNIKSSNFTV